MARAKRQNGSIILLTGTTMSNPYRSHIPPEILDCIVDLLHDKPETLKECCLVSKSWVPRTRKHLFADIRFLSVKHLESWKKTFPNPSGSPAYHTHTLSVGYTRAVTAADAEAGGWIQTFSRVVRLWLYRSTTSPSDSESPLTPFYKFSPVLKSLRVDAVFPCSHIFNLVCSFPLLEDLTLIGNSNDPRGPQTVVPSSLPALTGSLDLSILGGMGGIARRLLDLPNGLHFRKLSLWWFNKEDLRWITELVIRCSDTLECLDVRSYLSGTFVLVLRWNRNLPFFCS
jgi:hypothetical protein